jgi:2-amino-4-hydroxy-6-hydroxymethyldihydropteridine diphosphokinase
MVAATGSVPAWVGLGSNLAEPAAQVRAALAALARLPHTRLEASSALYRSAPLGRAEQPDFVNAVCRLATGLEPRALLAQLLELERAHGRVRGAERNGPRTLDLDLLLYGEERREQPGLSLPHPRLHERAFVLVPLAEIDPRLTVPGRGPVAALLAACRDQRIERLAD